jgi:hypothetical protein
MIYIAHRVNTIAELRRVPKEYGVEIDLRDQGNRLILQHDPFKDGEDLSDYLNDYQHSFLILNIKSERIEFRILELLKQHNISRFFLLDCSFPMIYHLSKEGESNIALRFSEFEGTDTLVSMRGKAQWVWIDCFTRWSINRKVFTLLRNSGYKLCLVSPELVGRENQISKYKNYLMEQGIVCDAICTKIHNISEWS